MSESNKKITLKQTLKQTLRSWKLYFSVCPGYFTWTAVSSAVSALAPYAPIYFSARIINELAGNRNQAELIKWVLLTLLVTAAFALANAALERVNMYYHDQMYFLQDKIYYKKMTELDYADIDRQEVLDLYSQIRQVENWGGYGIRKSINTYKDLLIAIFKIIGGVVLSVGMLTSGVPAGSSFNFLNSPLCVALVMVLMFFISWLSALLINKSESYYSSASSDATFANRLFMFFNFTVNEEKNRALDIRMYSQENIVAAYSNITTAFSRGGKIAKLGKGRMGITGGAGMAVSGLLMGVVYLYVCLKAWAGAFSVGMVTQYVAAITQFFDGISDLVKAMGIMRTNIEFLERTFEFLDIPSKMYKGSLTTEKRSDRKYDVEFRDVSFKYPGSDIWALRHVNMKFKVGSRLAVVGKNGSGKTTFIKLLCRLYDPTEGEILLNGIDIKKYRYDDYISIFSVTFQDFELFAMPLKQNVACSVRPDNSRVKACLNDAGFGARLSTMPNGIDTYLYKELDESGVEVSGGEAQKIAIARTLYKDAPFIVLDEPTAALDPIAEAEIYSSFNDIISDKTAIYISHRLSSCKFCDEIAVFDKGGVVQVGNHEELLADENGLYSRLWEAQAQYYDEDGEKKEI